MRTIHIGTPTVRCYYYFVFNELLWRFSLRNDRVRVVNSVEGSEFNDIIWYTYALHIDVFHESLKIFYRRPRRFRRAS